MIRQTLIPVLKGIRDCERIDQYKDDYIILMDIHISQLKHCCKLIKNNGKKIIIHLDLIKGLKSDDSAVDFLVNDYDVDGIISVKSSVIDKVKKMNKIAIQRIFIIDTQSYNKSLKLIKASKPDYIELLPGCLFKMITRIKENLNVEVIAGGLIETADEYKQAIKSGATSITTSKKELLNLAKK
ncbi:glycerol-3-phosphate responsive antiterminator [Haloplasma contractile]|uniref:Glycerol uptake operon antiterminator regulatory protein n=1 Tax=Haloplasma contractile SSD-17B TaxID=1033810 RepID=U2DT12_9MOLU|nr:glycerol-3-phosphate responsive antiterminator [Haloplasma contractile]ERJ11632.1 Glycerol uptake operon antiterminator regulatory protein [Haloplasma contractile SSD-17B]